MTITLTTPETSNPGHGHSGTSYPEVKIVQVDHDIIAKRLVLHMQYGETVSGEWVGSIDMERHTEPILNFEGIADGLGGWTEEPDPAYDLFMVSQYASSTSTFLYDEVSTVLYQYLIDDGRYVGTIT